MSTATAEPPAEKALLPHTFDPATGKCYEPEVVTIAVPKGCACVLRLAQSETGAWFHGYRLEAGEADVLDTFPADSTPPHATRAAALRAAASEAEQWFAASPKSKLHRKCAGLVTAFLIAQEGSPANSRPARAAAAIPEPRTAEVEVEGVTPNPHNPRGAISPESVAELAAAIEAVGLLQPVGIRLIPDESGLPGVGAVRRELLWGHRRLAAFQKLKRATIPARVYEGISDDQARLLLLIENGQRKDLDPIQEARGYADMMRDFELTQDDIAKAVKKSRPVVANALRLLELPADVQEMLADGRLTTAHGTALCRFKAWPAVCSRIAEIIVKERLSSSCIEKELTHDAFRDGLDDGKAAVYVPSWQFQGRLPNEFKADPDFMSCDYGWWCFAPAKFEQWQAAAEAKKKEEEAAARKRAAAARPVEKGEIIPKEYQWLADVMPPEKVGSRGGKLLCTDSRFWSSLVNEIRTLSRSADEKRISELCQLALESVKKAKSLSADWLAVIASDPETDFFPSREDFKKACTLVGVKAAGESAYEAAASVKPEPLLKVLVAMRLISWSEDPGYSDLDDTGAILIRLLGLKEVGFLEETDEGRAKIAAELRKKYKWPTPKASEVPGQPVAKAKPAKKGGKKK